LAERGGMSLFAVEKKNKKAKKWVTFLPQREMTLSARGELKKRTGVE
jgi:hypothetical protein